jgi:two-component system, NarL family, nitrate/nitrite response regulator NarL
MFSVTNTLRETSSPRVEPIRVLIAEDTPMGCQLLKDTLKRSRLGLGDIHCAVTSSQVVDLAAGHTVDVALISEDLQDGAYKGLHAVELLRATRPNTRSVVLVRRIGRELTLDAFRNGAKGVFCRKEPIEALGKCIRAVHKGQVWVDSEQLEVILQALVEAKPMRVTNLQGACLLTKREDEVAALVAEGLTNREVARRLGLSEHTVSNYLFKIYEKLGLSSRVEFVLYIFGRRQQNHANGMPPTGRITETQRPKV